MPQRGFIGQLLLFFLIIIVVGGFILLRIMAGYQGVQIVTQFFTQETPMVLPDQADFETIPAVASARYYIAERWKTNPDYLRVLYYVKYDFQQTVGIVDSESYNSAVIQIQDRKIEGAIDHLDNIYLISEAKPQTTQEASLFQTFYALPTPASKKAPSYAVITKITGECITSCEIQSQTSEGLYLTYTALGLPLKQIGYYPN